MAENQSGPWQFAIKDAPNAEATPVAGKGDEKDEIGNPPLQSYRFKLRTKDGNAQLAAVAVADPGLDVSDLKWDKDQFEHGTETQLSGRIKDYDGKPVRFVVEYEYDDGYWKSLAQVQAKVDDGVATGTLRLHHPILPPTGSTPSKSKLAAAQPVRLRFSLERGTADPQQRAVPQTVAASAQPKAHARVATGTLTVKGALAGEKFFILDARSKRPIKLGPQSKVKTSAVAAGGVVFILGKDRTATFEKLPAARYQVVFPPDPAEGKKPATPTVKANDLGAHVVDVHDFVQKGAVCEIEVTAGGTATLELTLSADGTARVCC
jgi:hypothetical protein